MYGQKTNVGVMSLSTGITAVSWWMYGVTIALAAIAAVLLVRVFITVRSSDESRRP